MKDAARMVRLCSQKYKTILLTIARTSILASATSAAREAANVVKKILLEAISYKCKYIKSSCLIFVPYKADIGLGINPALEEVKVTRPFNPLFNISSTKWCVKTSPEVTLVWKLAISLSRATSAYPPVVMKPALLHKIWTSISWVAFLTASK